LELGAWSLELGAGGWELGAGSRRQGVWGGELVEHRADVHHLRAGSRLPDSWLQAPSSTLPAVSGEMF